MVSKFLIILVVMGVVGASAAGVLNLAAGISPAHASLFRQTVLSGHADPNLKISADVYYETTRQIPLLCGYSEKDDASEAKAWKPWQQQENFSAESDKDGTYQLKFYLNDESGEICGWKATGLVILNITNKETGHSTDYALWSRDHADRGTPSNPDLGPDLGKNTGIACQEDSNTGLLSCDNKDTINSAKAQAYGFYSDESEIELNISLN